jgi:O-antigen/teichoic acid export membrane protein
LGFLFPILFPSVPNEYHVLIQLLLPVLAVNVWISAFRTVLSSVLSAHERFDLARGSDLVVLALRTVGTIAALELGYGLEGLAAAIIGCNIVGLLVNYGLACRVHTGLRLWPLIINKERVRELVNYGIGAFAIAVSAKIIGQTDLVLVGNLIDVEMVTVYSVGAMLLYYSNTFLGQVAYTLFPSLQKAVARGELGSARWLLFRQARLAMILSIVMFVGFISFGEDFIRLWMYDPDHFPLDAVGQAALVMAILSASKLLLLFSYGCNSVLSATGHIGFAAKMTVAQALTNLTFSVCFVIFFDLGLAGVAAGTFFARLVTETFVVPPYACHKIGLKWSSYLLVVGGSSLLAGVLFAIICYGIRSILVCNNWLDFSLQVGLALMFYVPICLLLLVTADDRKRLSHKIGELLPGFS